MGIRSTGWEIVCNDCGQVVGPFDLREEAEAAIVELGWAWWLPLKAGQQSIRWGRFGPRWPWFEASCPACAEKRKDKTP